MNLTLSQLSQALPIEGRCLQLRKDFNNSLIESLRYLLKSCEEVIDDITYTEINKKINSFNINSKLSGLLSAIHLKLYQAVKLKNTSDVLIVCNELRMKDFNIQDINYINFSQMSPFFLKILEEICSKEVERESEYYFLNNDDFERAKKIIQNGFKLLKASFVDFHQEATEVISEILILNAKGIQAGTSFDLFGMVHKNHTYKLDKTTDVLDFIIHEQSHLYIHLLTKKDALILNPIEKYESPLRKEPRPLIGIYHATFVLGRIIYVLEYLQHNNFLPASEKEYSFNLIKHYLERFQVGFKVLNDYAHMTELGTALIRSAKHLISH